MNQVPESTQKRRPRVLVVPLDWGLGHATRCIPVICELLNQEYEVWLAGEGAQENLLKNAFPAIPFLPLKGYRVAYTRSAAGFIPKILLQLPRLLGTIRRENSWLRQVVQEYSFDAVISDNRYGLYHGSIPSVFITHQLTIKSPFGKWASYLLRKRNYRLINRFTECWVPDTPGEKSLAGELSNPPKMPAIPVRYTGPLSRLSFQELTEEKDHLFISLSGPEPQRSLLENKLVEELSHYNGTATIVRGLPGAASLLPSTNTLHFYNHLPADAYAKEMARASLVICRSGYSTVMDLMRMKKKAVLIPTPGQPEQEYLGEYLLQKGRAACLRQKDFSLSAALELSKQFVYVTTNDPDTSIHLQSAVSSLLLKINAPHSAALG